MEGKVLLFVIKDVVRLQPAADICYISVVTRWVISVFINSYSPIGENAFCFEQLSSDR